MQLRLLLALAVSSALGCGRGLAPDTEIGRAASLSDASSLRALLKTGADPNLFDSQGLAPLHVAARLERLEAMDALIRAGARVDLRDHRNGWTPLLHAVHKRRKAAALALLETGADANEGMPLLMAAGYGETALVRALLERGANPRARLAAGPAMTALWAAVGGGAIADITDGPPFGTCFPDTVKALLERAPDLQLMEGAPMTKLVRALGRSEDCREAFALIERARGARRVAGRS
jgi:ankyrin repeat protein